jgi:hypothetical protein
MFVKILSRKNPSYRQLVEYILKDRKPTKTAKDILKHNIKGTSIESIVKEFEKNETYRTFTRKDQIALYHEIISLSSNEEHYIPDEVMIDLCHKYLDLRGAKGMYLAALHRDTEHCHAHIMTSALEYATGKAHRISRSALQDIKILLQDYHLQKYPLEITESFCDHSKGRTYAKNKEYHRRHKEERTKLKESVQQQVQDLFKQSKKFDEFLASLRVNGLHHYERNGIATGLTIGETKIRFSRLGISKEEMEQLRQPIIRQNDREIIQEPIKTTKMKITDFNRPLNTENAIYNIFDEFENPLDFETEKSLEERALDWLDEIEENPAISNDFYNELLSNESHSDNKEIDLEFDI